MYMDTTRAPPVLLGNVHSSHGKVFGRNEDPTAWGYI